MPGRAGRAGGRPRGGGPVTVLTGEAVCEILAATVTPPPESLRAQGVHALVGAAAGGAELPLAGGLRSGHAGSIGD